MVKQLYINGTGSGSYGVYINSDTFLNSPTLDFEEYQIPAVNGNLIAYNKRLNNVIRKFDCYINDNVLANLNNFKKLIYNNTGYMQIESDYDSDTYQYGYLAQEIEVSPFRENESVKFTLYFSCKPQKWYKTNTSGTKTVGSSNSRLVGVYPRTDVDINKAISLLPVDVQPTDDYYAVFNYTGVLTAQTVTSISAANSNGDLVFIYRKSYENYVTTYDLIGYGYGSVSVASYTFAENNTAISVVTRVSTDGTVTGSMTHSGGTGTISFNPSNYSLTVTNASAFGMDMLYELKYEIYPSDTVRFDAIALSGFQGTVKLSDALLIIHFDDVDASTLADIRANYVSSNEITVEIDKDFNAYVVTTGKKLDITSYLEFLGEIDGRCDTVKAVFYKRSNNSGTTKGGTLKPQWWCL